MDAAKIKKRARAFISRWEHAGKETADYQRFWLDLLQNVYVVEDALGALEFQKTVRLKHASYIDCYIPATKVLIEQKSSQTDLTRKQQQSDGAFCTPYEQAKRYADALPLSEKPRFIVACNFRQFLVYDLDAALKTQIEQAGAAIIEARKQYPDSSLADLYDKTVMPPVLHKAHQHNDALVLKAYGLPADAEPAEILSVLLTQYQTLSTGAKRAVDTAAADKSADQNKKTTQIPTKENKPC